MKRTRPPTRQHAAAYTCTPAQRCILSQLTKHNDDYTPGRGFFFFFPCKCTRVFTRSHQPYSQLDSRVFSSGAGDSLYTVWAPKNHDSIQLHSCRTMSDVSRPFSGMSIKGHTHSQNKKEWQEKTLCSQTLASDTVCDHQHNLFSSKPNSVMMVIWSVLHQPRSPPVMVNETLI